MGEGAIYHEEPFKAGGNDFITRSQPAKMKGHCRNSGEFWELAGTHAVLTPQS